MNVQTSSTNNGSVIKSNQESNFSNESKSNISNPTQPIQHPQSQLEITGVSRSSHPVTSQKESNRFRIVKTDADRKNEPLDDNGQNLVHSNEQGTVQNSLNKNFTDANSIQAKNLLNNYQRGRWHVAEFSTENFVSSKSSNHIGNISAQNQSKIEESSNLMSNQPNQTNLNEQNKVLSNTQSNAVTTNQTQSNNNPGASINFYLSNQQQIYHQSTQTSTQPYQILNQASSSNISQSSHQINSPASNNLAGNSSQIISSQNLTQSNQSNIGSNTKQTDNSNTQPHNQQNFPSQAQSQIVNVSSMNLKENISVGTQANSLINSQIAPQQTSPKDQNLVKLPNGVNSSENLQYNSNDSDAVSNDQTQETKKTDSGIHDKIAEAMDMVKSHLTQAVRDEIVTLKNQIKNLREHCSRLEQENRLLKTNMPSDILRQLENMGIFSYNGTTNNMTESDNRTQDNMLSSFTEKVLNKNDFLSNLQTSSK